MYRSFGSRLGSAISRTVAAVVLVIVVVAIIGGVAYYLSTRPPSPAATTSPPAVTTPTGMVTSPAATSPAATATQPPQVQRVLRIGGTWPIALDPAEAYDFISSTVVKEVYDPVFKPSSEGPKPWLVTEYSVSQDGLTWTFKVRQGVKFHSGRELTAKDIAFSIQRTLIMGKGLAGIFIVFINNATAVDDYTLQISLKRPTGLLPVLLTKMYVVDSEEVKSHIKPQGPYGSWGDFASEWLSQNDAGSGPYRVAEVRLGEYARFEKFKEYWNPSVFTQNSPDIVYAYPTPTMGAPTVLGMLQKRDLEITDQWQPVQFYSEASKIKGVKVAYISEPSVFYLMFNFQKPPLDDVHVRRALMYVLNYTAVTHDIFPGSLPARGPVPPNVPGWCEIPESRQDINKAKEELMKSKYYPDIVNNPSKYTIEYWWVAEVPDEEKVALLFARDVQQYLGLNIKVVKQPWTKVIEYMAKPDTSPHIVSIFVADNFGDAALFLFTRYHSMFEGTWQQNEWMMNKTVDSLLERALQTMDPSERRNIACTVQRMAYDDAWSAFMLVQTAYFAYQDYYIDWPAAKGSFIPVIGYEISWTQINVYPEKRQELLGG